MASKGIETIIAELIELGYSERKIANRLKEIKEDLIKEEEDCFFDNKKHNKLINGLLFGGRFCIENPSQPLLGLVKSIKKVHGSEFVYYMLYSILTECYFNSQIYDKTEYEKCNWLMWLMREKKDYYVRCFISVNKGCAEPK